MGTVQRQIDPDAERAYWERKVEIAVALYGKVRSRYSDGKFLDHVLGWHYIHMQPKNKYHRILRRTIEVLEALRAEHTNPLEHLLEDYLLCLHEYYHKTKRVPFMQQLYPSEMNLSLFGAWIRQWEQDHDQPYWITTTLTMEDITQRAAKAILAAQQAKVALLEAARTGTLEDTELQHAEPQEFNRKP